MTDPTALQSLADRAEGAGLEALAQKVEQGSGLDNALDVRIEVALFVPDDITTAARSNSAGTKVIYTGRDGREKTYWAEEWTADRKGAASALRATASQENSK